MASSLPSGVFKTYAGVSTAIYSDAVTRADWDHHEAVFAPDAVLEVASQFDFRGGGAAEIRNLTSAGSARLYFLIQTVDSVVIHLLESERAEATSTIHEMGRGVTFGPEGADVWLNGSSTACISMKS